MEQTLKIKDNHKKHKYDKNIIHKIKKKNKITFQKNTKEKLIET